MRVEPLRRRIVTVALIVVAALAAVLQSPVTAVGSNGRIVFVNVRSGSLDVWTMLPDGSDHLQLTSDLADDLDPSPSSDGSRYVFVSTRDANRELYTMKADGSNQTRLTSSAQAEQDPVFSPDDARIVFSRSTGSFEAHIWSMAPDGTDEMQLTFEFGDDSSPAYSPDGTKIAFVRESNVFVMDADGTNVTQLTEGGGTEPAFMADGRIAFRRANDIHVMDADGSSLTNITSTPTFEADPAPSPDGRLIAFTAFRDGQFDIDVMRSDGTERLTLTSATTDDLSAVWGATPDVVGPDVILDPDVRFRDRTPTFTFTSEPGARFECSVDAADFASCSSPYSPGYLKPGRHTLQVRATDRADNVGPVAVQEVKVTGPLER